jgi:hypothetical protein
LQNDVVRSLVEVAVVGQQRVVGFFVLLGRLETARHG